MTKANGSTISIVAVSGSISNPSRTTALAARLQAELAAALAAEPALAEPGAPVVATTLLELSDVGREFAGVLSRAELTPRAEEALRTIESADVLIVASPVFRASFTGLFKHVFDFVGQYALIDTPVLLAATGGSDRHALILEHQFRPLFSFFQALTLPIGVYARDTDFVDYQVSDPGLEARIAQAVERGLPLVRSTVLPAAARSEYVSTW
ncbi:FMN reductase [Agromyces seonyuensis]|uniref:FMN reductase n=1 Tax=Agromyces seonyuensis TaxID=2662446 RepID=A0A6I4NWE8_9MICO|nr:FMN reductase [Agromyces seonyuensis]MWB98471.1 FMN reductase [Agromyces seonyuensis]